MANFVNDGADADKVIQQAADDLLRSAVAQAVAEAPPLQEPPLRAPPPSLQTALMQSGLGDAALAELAQWGQQAVDDGVPPWDGANVPQQATGSTPVVPSYASFTVMQDIDNPDMYKVYRPYAIVHGIDWRPDNEPVLAVPSGQFVWFHAEYTPAAGTTAASLSCSVEVSATPPSASGDAGEDKRIYNVKIAEYASGTGGIRQLHTGAIVIMGGDVELAEGPGILIEKQSSGASKISAVWEALTPSASPAADDSQTESESSS